MKRISIGLLVLALTATVAYAALAGSAGVAPGAEARSTSTPAATTPAEAAFLRQYQHLRGQARTEAAFQRQYRQLQSQARVEADFLRQYEALRESAQTR